jgi:hypothetical protein
LNQLSETIADILQNVITKFDVETEPEKMIQLRDYLSTDKGSTIHGNSIGFINKNCFDYLGTSFFTNSERMSAFMQPGDKDQNRYPGAALFVMFGEMKDSSTLEYSDRGTYWTFILNVSLQMDPKGIAPVFASRYWQFQCSYVQIIL